MQERRRASWLAGVVLACHLCACGSDVTPVASGPETDFFLRSMLGPYSARLRDMNIQRGRPTTFMMADLEARAQEDPAHPPAPGPEHGVGTVVPQEGEDTLAEPHPHPNPVAGLKVTTGNSQEDETEGGSFRDVGPSEAPSATLQTLKPTADSAREQRASAPNEGYEIADDRPMREIGMSDLQQHAELRRFATFSEEQLQPFEVPALRWLANATITPLRKTVTEALDKAIQNLANQPEVLVWSLQPGDHLRVKGVAGFMALTHHAIYLGNGRIMHFTGGVTDKANATVRIDTLARLHKFTQSIGHTACRIEVIPHPPNALPRDKIVERAISREGEVGYNLFSKNCEHVVLWCINGEEQSLQVDRFTKDPFGLGLEILKEQADAGAPVNINEVCRTLLPPGLLQPLLVVAGLQRDAAEKARDLLSKAQQRVPRMPWQRDESWLDGVRRKLPPLPAWVPRTEAFQLPGWS